MRGEIISAYVLHSRDYRDTSRIADLYSLEYGRISAVFKGVRTVGKRRANLLEPFRRLSINVSGRSQLKTGSLNDTQRVLMPAQGVAMYSGLYLNELLVRLVGESEPNIELFAAYEWALDKLQQTGADHINDTLRAFEYHLLQSCGYPVDFIHDADSAKLQNEAHYVYVRQRGFIQSEQAADNRVCYVGAVLQDINNKVWHQASRLAAKTINRQALQVLLGDKPLASRQLFVGSLKGA